MQCAHRHARLIQVQERIVTRTSIAKAICNLALQSDGAAQPGSETGEIVVLPGTPPRIETAGLHTCHLLNKLARQFCFAIVIAPRRAYQSAISISIVRQPHYIAYLTAQASQSR